MKKIISAFIFLSFIPGTALAQQFESQEKIDSMNSWRTYVRSPQVVSFKKMDQRKTYKWRNGQKSTATGRQAGDRSAKWARIYGDSAMVVNKPSVKKNKN